MDESGWMDALLRSGELECALEDTASPQAELVGRVTDLLRRDRWCKESSGRKPEFVLPEGSSGRTDGIDAGRICVLRITPDALRRCGEKRSGP